MRSPFIRSIGTATAATSVGIPIDQRLLMEPNLATPAKKPVGNVEIDWDNPLTDGLHTALLFDNPTNFNDVAGRRDWQSYNDAIDIVPDNEGYGLVADVGSASTDAYIGLADGKNTFTEAVGVKPFSMLFIFKPRSFGDGGYGRIFDSNVTGSDTDSIMIWMHENNDTFYFRMGTLTLGFGDIDISLNLDKWWYATMVRAPSTVGLDNNGRMYITAGVIGGANYSGVTDPGTLYTGTLDGGNTNKIGNNRDDTRKFDGEFLLAYMWADRLITGSERDRLLADPYQILKPAGAMAEIVSIGAVSGEEPPPPDGHPSVPWMSFF